MARCTALGINGHNDTLRAIFLGGVSHQLRISDGRSVNADFVGTGIKQTTHVFDHPHPTADGERNKHLGGNGFDNVKNEIALVRGGRNVQKGELICPFPIIAARNLDRVTGVTQFEEINPFDDSAGGNVETRNDALGQGHVSLRRRTRQDRRRVRRRGLVLNADQVCLRKSNGHR